MFFFFCPADNNRFLILLLIRWQKLRQFQVLTTLKKTPFKNVRKGENAGIQHFSFFSQCFLLKVALQVLGRKFYKNTKKASLYSQSLLIFIHRTPVVERHRITREIRDLLWPRLTPTGNTIDFYMSSLFIYTLKVQRQCFKYEDIIENNYMFAMLHNLSVISHWIFPQYFCFYLWCQI